MTACSLERPNVSRPAWAQRGDGYDYLAAALPHLADHPDDDHTRLIASREFLKLGLLQPARSLLEQVHASAGGHPEIERILRQLPIAAATDTWAPRTARFEANLTALTAPRPAIRTAPVRRRPFTAPADRTPLTDLPAPANLTDLADLLRREWLAAKSRFELHTDAKKVDQVLYRSHDGRARWWPILADHPRLAAAAPLPPDHQERMPGPYLFEGLGLGWFFERVWKTTRDTFLGYAPALYVVEQNPAALAVALHLHHWTELLADERVMLFLGTGCHEALRDALLADDDLPAPRYRFKFGGHEALRDAGDALAPTHDAKTPTTLDTPAATTLDATHDATAAGAASDALAATLEAIIQSRYDRARRDLAALQDRYRSRDARYWSTRFAEALNGGPPLRILATVSTHTTFLQYAMRDAARALRRLGHRIEVLTELQPFTTVGPSTYHRHIRDFDPDLFFAIDHLRSSFPGVVPDNLPLLTWDQDGLRHIFTRENIAAMSPLDSVVGLPHVECTARFGRDRRQFLVAHMAACPEEFDGSKLSDADLAPYRCDVSYVSHGAQTAEAFHKAERDAMDHGAGADGPGRRLLDMLYERARERIAADHPPRCPPQRGRPIKGHTLRTILADAERATGLHVPDPAVREHLVSWYLWRLCDRMFRHQALEWVGRWAKARGRTLRIYGNGWENHPTLAPFAAGPAQNGRELLCIYRASTINLQLMPAGFLHQRALDGLAAGGFFLTRSTPADCRDPRIGPLLNEILAQGIQTAEQVINGGGGGDEGLIRRFAEFRESHGFRDEDADLALHTLFNEENWDYPADVFEGFDEIVFSDAASFEKAADRFIDDAALRQRCTESMRKVVLERYSYTATMQRFLSFMAEYMKRKTEPA